MFGNKLINTNAGGGCTDTVDLYNPFPDGGGVALYQLNGDATDVSGNYNGTVNGGTFEAGGEFGGCWDTTGTVDEYIQATQPPNVKTVSAWVNVTGTHTNSVGAIVWSNGAPSGPSVSYLLGISVDGKIYAFASYLDALTRTINLNQWYHIAATLEGTTVKVYFDGALVETRTSSFPEIVNGTQITMGRSNYAGNVHNLHGKLDQVRIFNRALRPYEVEALYTEEYCTPTIVPSEHFNTVLYTGNGGTNSVTGVGFQPDFVWVKSRSIANYNVLATSVQGVQKGLISSLTIAEFTDPTTLTSFDVNGFTVGSDTSYNTNGATMVSWNFKAGGSAVTNTDGTITSQVSANTEAGFSVVTFTSPNGASNTSYTVGHGLGITPNVVIAKSRNATGGWYTYHSSGTSNNQFIRLDTTGAVATAGSAVWGAGMTNNVIGVTLDQSIDQNDTNVAYCFAEVEGFSNFGSYVGNDVATTVVTGFEPAFVMVKNADAVGNWVIIDNKRSDNELYANTSGAEAQENSIPTLLENGFVLNGARYNNNGNKFIYMAFAADPTTIEPSLEDSFNTVLYSGNSSAQSVTGVGFQPDFTWIKSRNASWSNMVTDSVTGGGLYLSTNTTTAQAANSSAPTFDSDGFTLGGGNTNWNGSGLNYVAWNWKGAELPAINSNGSIPSVVSANPAAGFSIVKFTGNATSGSTIGHGLNNTPNFMIIRNIENTSEWLAWSSSVNNQLGYLNRTDSFLSSRYSWALNSTQPNSSVFTIGFDNGIYYNANNKEHIAYCFAEVAGFSKFGSYTGNSGSNAINVGFEPAFVMIKKSSGVGSWNIIDNKRGDDNYLTANYANAEGAMTTGSFDLTATGFTLNNSFSEWNASGGTYIYMAFANQF